MGHWEDLILLLLIALQQSPNMITTKSMLIGNLHDAFSMLNMEHIK